MKQYATEGQYGRAAAEGRELLAEYPQYDDAAVYLARVYGWQGSFDSAGAVLDPVLERDPELITARRARMDLAYWSGDWQELLTAAEGILADHPDDPDAREKYRLALYRLSLGMERTEGFARYSYDHFSVPYLRNWHMLTLGGSIPRGAFRIIPSVNAGIQAAAPDPNTDFQLNLDTYVTLGEKNYALAGYGFSPDGDANFLPVHRAALELWQVLPAGFSVSAGWRYFYWSEHFSFLTFSADKYAGNFLFTFRNYLFFKDYGTSASYYLTGKRFLRDRYNFLFATLGYGTAPDEPLLVESDLDRLTALSARLGFSWQISHLIRLTLRAGYSYEEYAEALHRNRFDLNTGVYIRPVW